MLQVTQGVEMESVRFSTVREKPLKYMSKTNKESYVNITSVDGSNPPNNKVISLFTGAGGMDIGLEDAGFETAVCVEIDEDCRETLKHNRKKWNVIEKEFEGTVGDIRHIDPQYLMDKAGVKKGEAALVVGGAPCQPFSNIGKRKGSDDPKNGDLFLEFVKVVKGTLPKGFIFENVAGITQSKHKDVVNYMTEHFKGLGYKISHKILNAADYGVPQKRERFFLIGIFGDKPALPLPTHFESSKKWREFVSDLNIKPDYKPNNWATVKEAFNSIDGLPESREDFAVMNSTQKVVNRMKLIEQGENFHVLPMDMRPNCWKNGKHSGTDTFGRLEENKPSVTIRTAAYNPSKGRYIHPHENRGLNTHEMAALQGFPKDWIIKCKNKDRVTLVSAGRQIGNAVPPKLACAIGKAIKVQVL